MFVSKVSLENFRNYSVLHQEFNDRLNVIYGPNASGKTNLIEAIYYLSLARSFKKAEDKDLIKIGASQAKIIIEYVSENDGKHIIEATILNQGKIIVFDGEKQKSVAKIVGKLLTVVYSPASVSLFRGEPMERRRFIDTTLSAMSSQYLYALTRQKKLLKERNTALSQNYDDDVLTVITKELINVSYRIFLERKALIMNYSKLITPIYQSLFGNNQKVELMYSSNLPDVNSQEEFTSQLQKKFDLIKTEERLRKMTLIGAQKDDLKAYLDGKDVYSYASQGQNRLLVLALVLCSAQVIKEHFHDKPVLLLDDVMSDLDQVRKEKLVNYLAACGQVFITTAEENPIKAVKDIYQVGDDKIERR